MFLSYLVQLWSMSEMNIRLLLLAIVIFPYKTDQSTWCGGESHCPENSACSSIDNRYECICNFGYHHTKFNLRYCEDIDECIQHPCHAKATCNNTEGSYNCTCTTGFDGDGSYCSAKIGGGMASMDADKEVLYVGVGVALSLLLLIVTVVVVVIIHRRRKRVRDTQRRGELGMTEMPLSTVPMHSNDSFQTPQLISNTCTITASGSPPQYECVHENMYSSVEADNPQIAGLSVGITKFTPGNPGKPELKPKPKNRIQARDERNDPAEDDEQSIIGGINVVEYHILESENPDEYNRLWMNKTSPPKFIQDTADGEFKLSGPCTVDDEPQSQSGYGVYNNLYGDIDQNPDTVAPDKVCPGMSTVSSDMITPTPDVSSYEPENTYCLVKSSSFYPANFYVPTSNLRSGNVEIGWIK